MRKKTLRQVADNLSRQISIACRDNKNIPDNVIAAYFELNDVLFSLPPTLTRHGQHTKQNAHAPK